MLESGGGNLILKVGQEHIQHQIEAHLRELLGERELPIPLPFITNYLAGALLSLIKWWIENDIPYNAEQMDTMFQAMAMPGIQDVLLGGKQN